MTKPGFIEDTFEKLAELGSTTTKKTGKTLKQTFSPLRMLERLAGLDNYESNNQHLEKNAPRDSHTPLDFEKLKETYKKQDQEKEASLRNRLFQLVKEGEKLEVERKKQEEMRKRQVEEREKAEKEKRKRMEEQQRVHEITPRGKIRKSIFSPKKVAQQKHAEFKPGGSKN